MLGVRLPFGYANSILVKMYPNVYLLFIQVTGNAMGSMDLTKTGKLAYTFSIMLQPCEILDLPQA